MDTSEHIILCGNGHVDYICVWRGYLRTMIQDNFHYFFFLSFFCFCFCFCFCVPARRRFQGMLAHRIMYDRTIILPRANAPNCRVLVVKFGCQHARKTYFLRKIHRLSPASYQEMQSYRLKCTVSYRYTAFYDIVIGLEVDIYISWECWTRYVPNFAFQDTG
jgi:hypothetical protein